MSEITIPITKCSLDSDGHEILSDVPISLPMGFKTPETLAEQVRRLVRHEQFAAQFGDDAETFEEADDFDIGDDYDPSSPFEQVFDQALQRDISPDEFLKNAKEYKKLYAKYAEEQMPIQPDEPPGSSIPDETPPEDDPKSTPP